MIICFIGTFDTFMYMLSVTTAAIRPTVIKYYYLPINEPQFAYFSKVRISIAVGSLFFTSSNRIKHYVNRKK